MFQIFFYFCQGYGSGFDFVCCDSSRTQGELVQRPPGTCCMQYSQRGQAGSGARVPQLDGLLVVLAARGHQGFDGVPVNALDVSSVTW